MTRTRALGLQERGVDQMLFGRREDQDRASVDEGGGTPSPPPVRGAADLVTVAEMLGHARLDTVRAYTRPTADDRAKALNLLPTDR